MENFQELQDKLFVSIKAIQAKCVLYLRDILLKTENQSIQFLQNDCPILYNSQIETSPGGSFLSIIGHSVLFAYMDCNEVAFNISEYVENNGEDLIRVYPETLDIMDLLDICKAVEQHKYI